MNEPEYLQMMRHLSSDQLCEMIESLGAICREKDWGPVLNAKLGTVLLRQAVNMYEAKACFVELCIQSPHWEQPTYYRTGDGAVAPTDAEEEDDLR